MERYVKLYTKIDDIKDIWESLYSGGTDMTPVQSFEWNKNIAECYRTNTYIFLNYSVRYFVCFKDREPLVIAPLALPKNKLNPDTYTQLLGEYTGIGSLNLIYGNEASDEDFRFLIEYITSTYNCELRFCEAADFTRFSSFLESFERAEKLSEKARTRCSVPASQEETDSLLSGRLKAAVENLRDEKSKLNVEIYHGYKFGSAELEELNELCRWAQGEPERTPPKALSSGMKKLKKLQRKIFRNKDAVLNFSKNESFVFVKLVADGRLAGFIFAVTDRNGYCTAVKFAADSDYAERAPSALMVYELIRDGIENENLTAFDLSRGCGDDILEVLPSPEVYFTADYSVKPDETVTAEVIE